ncbi:MAG: hypothetical protein KIS68_12315 [Bauldia sp.]|nr:hypothetical protein [Bauldia sp.]
MDAARLLKLVNDALALETQFKLQERLTAFKDVFTQLVRQPAEAQFQTDMADKLKRLEEGLRSAHAKMSPVELENLYDIDVGYYFDSEMVADIKKEITNNAMTPAVTQKFVTDSTSERAAKIATLEVIKEEFKTLGISAITVKPGEAEIGFLLPRALFNNELDGLTDELEVLNRILRLFGEAASDGHKSFSVRSISTTDQYSFLAQM